MTKLSPPDFNCKDHRGCVETALLRAERHCETVGLNFTPVRRRSLEILLRDHQALSAYELLAQLAKDGLGSQPPVAYRALEFLVNAGLAHKIEALNAYVACTHGAGRHAPSFLVCRKCRTVSETDLTDAEVHLGSIARASGFLIERAVVEAQGLCPNCQ